VTEVAAKVGVSRQTLHTWPARCRDGGGLGGVTGVDDHSRYCVLAAVVPQATGRAVRLAFAAALARSGVPEEVLTDNGKQFTDRFGAGGEVLFDRIHPRRPAGDRPRPSPGAGPSPSTSARTAVGFPISSRAS
jgi:hypothetical protein